MKRRRPGGKAPALMLTSLLDMFTIILIFLIVSFEADDEKLELAPGIELPESSARIPLKPTVNVAITSDQILIENETIADLSRYVGQEEIPELSAALKKIHDARYGQPPATTANDSADESAADEAILVVQSDKQIDYRTLYMVLRSAAQAGFFKYRLAMLKV